MTNIKEFRVRSKTEVAKLAQSIAHALRQDPVIAISAVGVQACHQAQRGIGASADMLQSRPWVQIHLQKMEFTDEDCGVREREGTVFIVARDLEAAADYEASLEKAE
ncbi:MAG: stage V sporulation protein S [Alicyclobacillus sp.]|nr:stage V sporulation protein S [Alicyclobacillus sp.]